MDIAALLPLLAPAALICAALLAHRASNEPPRARAATRAAALVSLLVAAMVAVLCARLGPMSSLVLGVGGLGFAVRVDGLSVAMLGLVASLGAALLHFSERYLDGDARHAAFLRDLALTVASVMLLVLSGNLAQLVVMWSVTSLALHRLLLFYPERRGAIVAGKKKFIVARAGDLCLLVAAALIVHAYGTGDVAALGRAAPHAEVGLSRHAAAHEVTIAAVLLVLTAGLKAAQFPFHGWLVEMQETPTPVSALLHAGILNGGTFLIVRLAGVVQVSPVATAALVVIGGSSAVFASLVMITDPRVKTTLAYSSAAHMGFMLLLCGLGAYSVAIVHLIAHSFYKAHAFLSSGSAVDVARARAVPASPSRRGVYATALGLIAASALVWGVGAALGFSVLASPTSAALAVVLSLGLAHLIAQGASGEVIGRSLLSAALTSAAFFVLEIVGVAVLGEALPRPAPLAPATLVLGVGVLAVFAAVIVFQLALPDLARSKLLAAAYVHVRNGLYANAYLDRVVRAWKRTPRAESTLVSEIVKPALASETSLTKDAVRAAVEHATERLAPVWPLERFVAVNPFLGLAERSFEHAAGVMARVAGARMTMPRAFYEEAIGSGRITEAHLAAALEEARARGAMDLPGDVTQLRAALRSAAPRPSPYPAVADVVADVTGTEWPAIVVERFGAFAAAYFDEGQASWRSPWKERPAFEAWREEALRDATPEILGAVGFRSFIATLPSDAARAIEVAVSRLGVPADALELYFARLLYTVGGWSAYARHLVWEDALHGKKNDVLEQLLAVRLAWELALLETSGRAEAWASVRYAFTHKPEPLGGIDLVLQSAYEKAWEEELTAKLATSAPRRARAERPSVQAAFCIDVRSEVYRRALEAEDARCETIGFAGFFGFPVEYIPVGHERGMSQCPVLLSTAATIAEAPVGASDHDVAATRIARRRAKNAWKSFKNGAVASFSFVGPVGLAFAPKLLTDALGLSRAVPHPSRDGIDAAVELAPRLDRHTRAGREVGLTLEERATMAEGLLRGMSLLDGFARLVLLVGHGSTTVNNPHAAGLDCGACGGRTGEANARIAAAALNDAEVRAALAARGIEIPRDTIFLGALHDTTTDEVRIFDQRVVPATHATDLAEIEATLGRATVRARELRAPRLGVDRASSEALVQRSRDWSQVRPEWGLAGCAAFIVAPRGRTEGADLGGRAFLHSYDWREDQDFKVLELVMTAPMVVGSWISLQYYASTVDNRVFGCGNKVLHNVVGAVGVLEGNSGDLRVGLPTQSIHDGERLVHEPVRLHVAIEAPIEAMNTILVKHPRVKALVDNGWLHLFAMGDAGTITHRYVGDLTWEPTSLAPNLAAAE